MMGGGRTAAKKILGELILNFGSGRVKKKGVVLERIYCNARRRSGQQKS
jgi:hypothetical protein